jgi:transposase
MSLFPGCEIATCADGYKWSADKDLGLLLEPAGTNRRSYNPADVPGLFLEFAEVPLEPEAFQAFADRYGLLGLSGEGRDLLPDWINRVRWMHALVQHWKRWSQAGLTDVVRWRVSEESGLAVYCVQPRDGRESASEAVQAVLVDEALRSPGPSPREVLIASSTFRPETLQRFRPGELAGPALQYLIDQLNEQLTQHVIFGLEHVAGEPPASFGCRPKNLWGALCLQFSQVVAGVMTLRVCPVCGRRFDVSAEGVRTSRVFCSEACKSRDYRQRKERTQVLHEAGKSVDEIASELSTDRSTVANWVRGLKIKGDLQRLSQIANTILDPQGYGKVKAKARELHDEGKTLEDIANELGVDVATVKRLLKSEASSPKGG